MTNKLTAIVLNTSGFKYPRASFVRCRDGVRTSRVYKLNRRRWLVLHSAGAHFMPAYDCGWLVWVRL